MEVLKTPSGVNLPPSPEGKAMSRRLWAEQEAKTGTKGERDQLSDEQMKENERLLREERNRFEREQREQREREQQEQNEREQREHREQREQREQREHENRERENRELRERDREREKEMREMRDREQRAAKQREQELIAEIERLRLTAANGTAREDWKSGDDSIWADGDELELAGSQLGSGIDSVLELSALLNLDHALRDTRKGKVTVYELFSEEAVQSLQKKLSENIVGSLAVEYALNQFMAAFRALKKSRIHTQKMIMMLARR